jgi:hypothetical protein
MSLPRKQFLGSFEDEAEALRACQQYTESTGLYARVVTQTVPNGSVVHVAYGYNEPCRLGNYIPNMTHAGLRILARSYLNATALKQSLTMMARKPTAPDIVRSIVNDVAEDKGRILARAEAIIQNHPVYKWCSIISAGRGGSLGASAALLFLGFIDPHEANTAGKARKYWGLSPEGKLRSGTKASFNPWLKGAAFFMAQRVIMGRDSYYHPLYLAKKEYYASVRKIPHAHSKATFWLASLLVSHAHEIIRKSEGLEVFLHRGHIYPKVEPGQEPPERLLDFLRKGTLPEERG